MNATSRLKRIQEVILNLSIIFITFVKIDWCNKMEKQLNIGILNLNQTLFSLKILKSLKIISQIRFNFGKKAKKLRH